MIVTEKEAKTKACCGGINCGGPLSAVTSSGLLKPHCLGSACMAWRWVMRPFNVTKNEWMEDSHAVDANEAIEWRGLGGYCGKAGKP